MIVHTANSVYKVVEQEGSPRFLVEKVDDKYPGGHPSSKVGQVRAGNALHVKVGEPMILTERTDGRFAFYTTRVIGIKL